MADDEYARLSQRSRSRPQSALVPGPGEPAMTRWREVTFSVFVDEVLDAAGAVEDRPALVGIDGRGGGGKSTLARRIADAVPASAVLSTDDLAWGYSIFGWDGMLVEHVLEPLRRGDLVDFEPLGWITENREGRVAVPSGLDLVVVEGTGAIRADIAELLDATIWMQADYEEAKVRAIERDILTGVNGDREQTTAFWELWQREEVPFFLADRPWERATRVVASSPVIPLSSGSVAVAAPSVAIRSVR